MFSFFRDKEDKHKKFSEEFRNSFTSGQKLAIIACLVSMARSDGEPHPKELKLVEQARKLLGIELGDPELTQTLKSKKEILLDALNSMDQKKKEWLVSALHSILLADGKVEESEIIFIKEFCKELGISEFEYRKIIHS